MCVCVCVCVCVCIYIYIYEQDLVLKDLLVLICQPPTNHLKIYHSPACFQFS